MPPALVVGGDRDLLTGVQHPWAEQPEAFREVLEEWFTRRGSDESHRSESSEAAVVRQEPVSLTDPV
jgi:hypothetical protein